MLIGFLYGMSPVQRNTSGHEKNVAVDVAHLTFPVIAQKQRIRCGSRTFF